MGLKILFENLNLVRNSLQSSLKAHNHMVDWSLQWTLLFLELSHCTMSAMHRWGEEAFKGRTAGTELKVNIKCLSAAEFFFLYKSIKRGKNKMDGGGGTVAKDTRQTPPETLWDVPTLWSPQKTTCGNSGLPLRTRTHRQLPWLQNSSNIFFVCNLQWKSAHKTQPRR